MEDSGELQAACIKAAIAHSVVSPHDWYISIGTLVSLGVQG